MVKPESIPESIQEVEILDSVKASKVTEFLQAVKTHYGEDSLPPLLTREKTEERQRLLGYKFMKARKWKLKDALAMFTSTVDFRSERKLDELRLFPCAFPLLGFDEAAIEAFLRENGSENVCDRMPDDTYEVCSQTLQKSYVNLYHYTDKVGHPVLYDCCGQCDASQIVKDFEALAAKGQTINDVVIPYHIYMNEVQHHLIRYADHVSQAGGGRPITGITVVMNAKGFSLGMIQRKTVQLVRGFLDVDQKHYPEVLHRLFVINCPSVVQAAFNLVKRSLDENTRNKIIFCGKSESLAVLQRVIDNEKIPSELGGECHCEGGCLRKTERSSPSPSSSPKSSKGPTSNQREEEMSLASSHSKASK